MIKVTCAIIRNEENDILVVQRGEKTDHPFKWEFPGGKIKEGESDEECIIREIREELSMDIIICRKLDGVAYDYGFKKILLIPFVCDTLEELPVLSEHISFRWISARDWSSLDLSEADRIVAEQYLNIFSSENDENDCSPSGNPGSVNEEELRTMVAGVRGTREAEFLAVSASENPALLGKIFEYSFSDDQKLSFHASWALSKTCDRFPEVITPFLARLVDSLENVKNQSVERSFLRVASMADLGELDSRHLGILADHCFASLRSGFSAIAIKAYSMEILYKLAMIYPDLSKELADTINMLTGEGSAGIIAKGKIVLKRLERELRGRGSSLS
jgi:8-oxo-dGTP diphosphatase